MSQSNTGALKLHQYIMAEHWKRDALVGPDPGVRFNYRLGRFMKSYLPRIAWADEYYYLQAQGYWVLANWALCKRTGEAAYREIALRCSNTMLDQQRDNGAWDFPNPEWKGRIPAAEGTWGSIGLVESYRHSAEPRFLVGALRWHKFLLDEIGFQSVGEELAVNYFSNRPSQRVPNNSAFLLRFLAELSDVTGDSMYLVSSKGLLTFLRNSQRPNGEFPYAVPGPLAGGARLHFQCYQYNAFQCLDLMRFYELSGERSVVPLITRVLQFLCGDLADDGHAYYDCEDHTREVTYHTGALAASFTRARDLGIEGYEDFSKRAYSYLAGRQRPDGGFGHSRRDYGLLSDRRSYPRYLAMILYHLLLREPSNEKESSHEERLGSLA